MSGRSWIFLVVVLVVAGLLVLASSGGVADSPEHRSDSDGPNGTSALLQYARAEGHATRTLEASFTLTPEIGLLFVFTPTTEISAEDISRLRAWLEQGGVLIYATEEGRGRLDSEFTLQRGGSAALGRGTGVTELLPGVNRVSGAVAVAPFRPLADQVVVLRGDQGEPLAVSQTIGAGRLVALADPLELTNIHIDQDDNWRLAADLLALSPHAPAAFDEYHHGAGASSSSPYSIFQFAWAQGLLAATAVVFFGLALRGRAFGPRLPLTPNTGRPSQEYVSAVGRLLKRARARRLTLEVLLAATRRQIQVRVGLARGGPAADQALERRAPELAGSLAAVESDLAGAAASDSALVEAARRLHDLAQPLTGGARTT